MELTELRRIRNNNINSKSLPEFKNGLSGNTLADQLGGWQPTQQYYPKALSSTNPLFDVSTLGPEMPTVKDLGIPSGNTVIPITATPDQKSLITGDTTTGHNFDNGLQKIKPTKTSAVTNVGAAANIVPAAIAFGTDLHDSANYGVTKEELMAQGGQSQQSTGGIGYDVYNGVNMPQFKAQVAKENRQNTLKTVGSGAALGAAVGSIIPGLGTVAGGIIGGAAGFIGSLFGSSRRKKKALEQARMANRDVAIHNDFQKDGAETMRLQQDAAKREGNSQAQLRGNFALGRGLDFEGGLGKVSDHEVFVAGDRVLGQMPGKANFKDDNVVNIPRGVGIVSNNVSDITGMRNSDYVIKTRDVAGGLLLDAISRAKKGVGYKNGKLPEFKEGYLGNLIPSGLGMLASVGQYLDASGQDIRSPQIYSGNPYEQSALNDLAGLRINQYPIINQINNATARADNAVRMSGGLSGYQRSQLRAANLLNTQKSISDTLMNAQMQNNQYRANLANAKMQLGSQYAQRMQQARMFNEEMLAKAHAARQQGKQMGIYNFLNQLQSYYANEFKRRQFNDTMDLYRQQQALDRDKFNAAFPNYGKAKPTITMKPLTNAEIKRLGGLQLPYSSLAYTNDLYARMNAFKPKLIKK